MNIYKYVFNWKYKHFVKKKRSVLMMVEDLQFKKFKTLQIREKEREDYTSICSRLGDINERIKSEKGEPTLSTDEIKGLDDQKALLERDKERKELRLKEIDIEIQGTRPTDEYPDGADGIEQQIELLHNLAHTIDIWLKA